MAVRSGEHVSKILVHHPSCPMWRIDLSFLFLVSFKIGRFGRSAMASRATCLLHSTGLCTRARSQGNALEQASRVVRGRPLRLPFLAVLVQRQRSRGKPCAFPPSPPPRYLGEGPAARRHGMPQMYRKNLGGEEGGYSVPPRVAPLFAWPLE